MAGRRSGCAPVQSGINVTARDEMIERIVRANFGEERHQKICRQAIEKALREVPRHSVPRGHGFVINREGMAYEDMEKCGTVVIRAEKNGGVTIEVSDFEFRESASCRQTVAKAVAWTRDVLGAATQMEKLVPGGDIRVIEASE